MILEDVAQKILKDETLQRAVVPAGRHHRIWDPVRARFTLDALDYIAAIPAILSGLVLVCQLLRPLWNRRPQWLREFNKSAPTQDHADGQSNRHHAAYVPLVLQVISLAGFVSQALYLPQQLVVNQPPYDMELYVLLAWTIAWVWMLVLRPRTMPLSLLIIYAGIALTEAVVFINNPSSLDPENTARLISLVFALIATLTILVMPLQDRHLSDQQTSSSSDPPTSNKRSPEDNLLLFQFLTVSWMSPMISVGSSRQLNDADVWSLSHQFQHKDLYENFRQLSGSVLKKLLKANGYDLILITLLSILEMCANLSIPVLLQQVLRSMEDSEAPKTATLTYAVLSLAVRLIAAQSAVINLWYSRRVYERSRGEMITLLHEKALTRKIIGRLGTEVDDFETNDYDNEDETNSDRPPTKPAKSWLNKAQRAFNQSMSMLAKVYRTPKKLFKQRDNLLVEVKQPASKGKILNILRNDAYEVAQRFWECPDLVTKPLGLILCVVLIWRLIGWACLIGVVAVIVAQILNALVARMLMKWERYRRVTTDTKLQKIAEVVEAIRHLRWYAWQDSWLSRIMQARQRELNYRIITGLWGILISFINNLSSGLFPVIAFWAYTTLAGLPLRIDVIFPALQLFGMLKSNLKEIPNLITVMLNAAVAMGRINDFMKEPDVPQGEKDPEVDHVAMDDASFAWPGTDREVLRGITANFPIGVTLVCGKVASGKSALLQALLGELDHLSGEFVRPDEITGYCSQTPWLQNMSIRENILFSLPYEPSRYRQVIEACALLPDLANFQHGDLSSIGENGIGLSGGQKARVALARAVYSNAKILLLDDPISALDYNTSEFIVEKCFRGPLLEGRIVVLVTHRVELCRSLAVQVLELNDGQARLLDTQEPLSSTDASNSDANESTLSDNEAEDSAAIPQNFTVEEYRAHGGVKFSVYWRYIKAGKLHWWFVLICVLAINRLLGIGLSWFLKAWAEGYEAPREEAVHVSDPFDSFPPPYQNVRPWLISLFALVVLRAVVYLIAQLIMLLLVYTAGKKLFGGVMRRVCYATFRFYDITPVGRLMNRLTSDISTIDGNISQRFQAVSFLLIAWLFSLVVIATVTPLFLVFSAILTIAFVLIFRRFLPTSQSLRRLEMVSLSPLMSNFGVLLDGLMTVRAFGAENRFQDRLISTVDSFQKMDHFYWSLQAWLMYRLDTLSALSTLVLTILALYGGVSPGLTAFVLIASNKCKFAPAITLNSPSANKHKVVESTHGLCKQYGKLQMDFVSVERVVELLDLEQEPVGEPVPAYWPSMTPTITFSNVTIRYAAQDDPALSNVSFTLNGGTNTALIGRTGSGKSTLALALLATVRAESGQILIDGLDVATADTQALRSAITFVAQDPVLFPGTLRDNLDPLGEHSEAASLSVLQKVAARHAWTLGTRVDTHGKNLSQGQRQLVALARAVLRKSPVVVLDEATASIDAETSMDVQRVLREEMRGSTVVTIAHRVEAVRDADWCIELSKGSVARQGTPEEILGR